MRTPRIAMAALLLAPCALAAEQLEYGGRVGASWSDNVTGVPEDDELEDPVDDYSLRISPFAEVSDPDGNFTWDLRYQPTYEAYLDQTELDGFDQDVSGSATWRFAPRWTLTLREGYAIYQNTIRFNEAVGPGEEVTPGFENQEIRANRSALILNHGLTRRDSLQLNLGYVSYQYPDDDGVDRDVPSASLWYQHILSERTTLGSRVSWTRQVYQRAGGDDETSFYNLAGTLEHRFSPTFRVVASAGPTLVDSSPVTEFEPLQFAAARRGIAGGVFNLTFDADACEFDGVPGRASVFSFNGCSLNSNYVIDDDELEELIRLTAPVPTVDKQGLLIDSGDTGGTDLTYFAHLGLVKEWESWNGSISYDRSNSENSRFGSSGVADTLSGSLTWRPRQLWTVGLTAAASRQEQAGDQVIPFAFDLVNAPAPPGVVPAGCTTPPDGPNCQIAMITRVIASDESNSEQYDSYSLSATATRQLTRTASAFASVYWYRATQDLGADDERWNNLVFWIGIDWKFDPIRF